MGHYPEPHYVDYLQSAAKGTEKTSGYQVPEEGPVMFGEPDPIQEGATGLDDVDFCLELLHSDIINVAYILELIADLICQDTCCGSP